MINDSINRFLGILCYPFVSLEMFRKDSIQEYIDNSNKQQNSHQRETPSKETIRRNVLDYIRQNYNIYSYDEVYLYLDTCYLYDAGQYENAIQLYQNTMKKMATTLISHRDGKIVFKYWKNVDDQNIFGGFAGNSKITLFHSLNCHIPLDVIAILYMVINQRKQDSSCLNYFYGNIEVADQQLSQLLEKGVAENHLHKGVSRTFSSIWDSLMLPFTKDNTNSFRGTLLPGSIKEKNNELIFYILGSGIARIWMCLRLSPKWNEYIETELKEIDDLIKLFCSGAKFQELYENKFKGNKPEIFSFYHLLWEKLGDFLPDYSFHQKLCSLILEEPSSLHTFDENVFLYHALYKMFNETDQLFNQCLMQYLRVRNYLFHISVQQKTIKGLDFFQLEHYRINSLLNRMNVNNFWENALREQLQNHNLHKIEFRTSMPESYTYFKRDVKSFLEAYRTVLKEDYCRKDNQSEETWIPVRRFPQVGLVIHFLKRQDQTTPEKCIQNGIEDCSYLQYGEISQSYKKQVDSFLKLRSEFSELSRYLVGIDAASLENSTPVWVFAPIYEQARDSTVDFIGKHLTDQDDGYIQSLGFTFHAGEDFRHILSGLRRIDEAVEYLKFHAGDRIGRGIALGINARLWKNQNPVVIIPQIEALENYLWAYDMLSKNYNDFQATVLTYMEKKIFDLADKIYGNVESLKTDTLIKAYQKLFSFDCTEAMQIINKELCEKVCLNQKIEWTVKLLIAARHCKKFVREMERPIHYEITEQDLLIIEGLQKIMMEKLGNEGIVVEVNPTSNTAIADMDVFGENQFYQLNQIFDKHNVIACINSDDPAVFNTNVSNEMAYIYYGMLEQGISRDAGLSWIDKIRKNGINSSFIRHNETDEILLERLNRLIENM